MGTEEKSEKRTFDGPLDHEHDYYWADIAEEIREILADEELWARYAAEFALRHGTRPEASLADRNEHL